MDTAIIYSIEKETAGITFPMENLEGEIHDNEVIQRVLQGNADDFEVILNRYQALVLNIVTKHLPYDMVEETAHNVFIKAYNSLPAFGGDSPFKHWLSKIAVRTCYDFWREQYKSKEVVMNSLSEEEHYGWFDSLIASRSMESFKHEESLKEAKEALNWALDRLSAKDRMVLSMVYLEGLSVREAADLLGWSIVNVKIRSHRARKELRKQLTKLAGKGDESWEGTKKI